MLTACLGPAVLKGHGAFEVGIGARLTPRACILREIERRGDTLAGMKRLHEVAMVR
jgi:hypothetical protein